MLRYLVLLLVALFGAAMAGDSCLVDPYLTRAGYTEFDFVSGTAYGSAVPDGVRIQGTCESGGLHNLVCNDGVWIRTDNPDGSTKIGCPN